MVRLSPTRSIPTTNGRYSEMLIVLQPMDLRRYRSMKNSRDCEPSIVIRITSAFWRSVMVCGAV